MPEPVAPLVLYVDDEAPNRIVFEQSLKSEFRIETVPDATTALERMAATEVAVLVTDIRMPEVDGLDLLRVTKDRHPNVLRMVITAYSDIDPILRAINEGLVARYIVKPWQRNELVQVLRWATELWTFGRASVDLLRRMLETERLASLGSSTALFVHDLRTPLMMVNQTLDDLRAVGEAVPALRAAIQSAEIDPAVKARLLDKVDTVPELVADAKQASATLDHMVGMLHEFITPGSKRHEPPVIDPLPIVQQAVTMYQRLAVPATTSIGYRGPSHLPHIRMSPVELTQVLINVLGNATQAVVARGEPNRSVDVEACTRGTMLELRVRDDGTGIPPEILGRIGTPWFTTREGGVGLGIANCQRLVGSVGGRLMIESELGVGTTVTILLPTAGD